MSFLLLPEEIKKIKRGGKILSLILRKLLYLIYQKKTGDEIEEYALKLIKEAKAIPVFKQVKNEKGELYPAAICLCLNEEVVHALPFNKRIKNGDLVSIDIGLRYQGLVTDMAWTVYINGQNRKIAKMVQANKQALFSAVKNAHPPNFAEDLSLAIENKAKQLGFYPVKELTGHGVGHSLHGQPIIYNFYPGYKRTPLEPNTAVAIEPIFALRPYKKLHLKDSWGIVLQRGNVASHFEVSILIKNKKAEILTPAPL